MFAPHQTPLLSVIWLHCQEIPLVVSLSFLGCCFFFFHPESLNLFQDLPDKRTEASRSDIIDVEVDCNWLTFLSVLVQRRLFISLQVKEMECNLLFFFSTISGCVGRFWNFPVTLTLFSQPLEGIHSKLCCNTSEALSCHMVEIQISGEWRSRSFRITEMLPLFCVLVRLNVVLLSLVSSLS